MSQIDPRGRAKRIQILRWILFGGECKLPPRARGPLQTEPRPIHFETNGLAKLLGGVLVFLLAKPAVFLLGTMGLVQFHYPAEYAAFGPVGQYLMLLAAQLAYVISLIDFGFVFGIVDVPQPASPAARILLAILFLALSLVSIGLVYVGATTIRTNINTVRRRQEDLSECT